MAETIHLRLICDYPPPTGYERQVAEFGMQDKKQQVYPGLALPDGSLQFDLTVQVKERDGQLDFAGSMVQGSPGQRFIYLSYRLAAAGSPWIKRLKIPLSALTIAHIQQTGPGKIWQTKVDGRQAATIHLQAEDWVPVN